MSTNAHKVSDLARLAGVRQRTIQFWCQEGVLQPEPGTRNAGRGISREFGQSETKIAVLLGELSGYSIQVGALRGFAEDLRAMFRVIRYLDITTLEDAENASLTERAARIKQKAGEESKSFSAFIESLGLDAESIGDSNLDDDALRLIELWEALHRTDDTMLMLCRFEGEAWSFRVEPSQAGPQMADFLAQHTSCVSINVTRLWANL